MAQSNRVQSTTIAFNVQGIQEIFGYHKKIKDSMKEIIELKKKSLAESGKVGAEYEAEAKHIKALETEMRRYSKTANDLQGILENTGKASAKQLQQAEKALKNLRDGIKFDGKKIGVADAEKMVGNFNKEIERVRKQLETIQADAHNATGFKMVGKSVQQLNDYITNFEKNAQFLTSQMQNGKQVFAEWGAKATEAKIRMGQLDGTLLSVNKNTNAETLQAYIKGWQDIAKYGGASAEQVAKANEHIARAEGLMRDMMQKRIDNAGKTNLAGKEYYSPAQVRESVEYMKQLSTSEKLTAEEREKLNASIKRGDEYLKQLTLDQQRYSMQLQLGGKQMSNIKTLSDASLASQKKYWTDMVASAERGTAEYNQYLSTLQAVTNEEQRRASQKTLAEGGRLVGQVNTGQFQGSIRETEEAIKKIQEYKKELKGPQQENMLLYAEQALTKLNEKLQQATTEAINGKKAFNDLASAAEKGVDEVAAKLPASSEALKKMRSDLEAYKKSLKNPDTSQLKQIETMFTAIDKKQREVASSEITWANYKGSKLKERSVAELKNAYEVLKKEIEGLSPAQEGYNKKAMQLREIDGRLKQLNKTMGEHKTSLENAASRLKNYVMIYLGFNAVMNKTRQIIRDVMKLSDQMVNVQKVTQMSNEEVERLVRNIQSLDTRTSTENLMAFAEQAGKLGIYAKNGLEGMKQFVEMGDRISKTLGEDIGGAQAIADLAKVNDIMNVTARTMERTGNEATVMRDALNATGSAILNVGNNSAASYGAIVEYVGRLGAISASSGIAMEETVALGGALDALKMPAEAGSTALSQFINAVVRNTDAMAQAAKVSVVELRNLVQSGQTYKAVTLLFNKVADGTTTAQKLMDAMTGRSRTNVNIRNVIQLLSGHMELLNKQLEYAQSGFESAFSQKTANDVQLIANALKGIGMRGTLTDILAVYESIKDGTYDVKAYAERLSKSGHDVDMLTQALNNTVVAMTDLDRQGKLNIDTMSALTVSTGQASIMEQEFERVNESAAARFERLGRMMHELFVNEESVKFWSDMSKGLMDFIEWMQSGESGARKLGTALTMLITYLIAVRMNVEQLIAVNLWGTLKKWYIAIQALITGTTNWTKAWKGLKAAMASNWFTLAATLLAGIVYWIKSAADESSRFAKATAEVKDALLDERREAALLFAQLQNLNMTEDERRRIIERINSKYGTLIGYMIDENTRGQRLAQTYELINAKLREKAKLQLQDELMKEAGKTGADKIKSGIKLLSEQSDMYFGDNVKRSATFQTKALDYINRAIASNPNRTAVQITESVMKTLKDEKIALPYGGKERSAQEYGLRKAISDIAEGQLEQTRATQRVSRFISGQDLVDTEENQKVFVGDLRSTNKRISSVLKTFRDKKDSVTDEQLNEALQDMNRVLNDKDIMGAVKKGSVDEKVVQSFRYFTRQMSAEQTRRAGITPWGDASTTGKAMEDWTTEALQAYHDKLKNTAIAAAPNADWSQIFPDIIGLRQGMTVQEVQKFVDEEDEKVQEILKSRHMGLNDFQHPKERDSRKKQETEMKELMDATLKKLEEYYERRNMMAEKYLNEGQISEEEYNRYMFANEQEHLLERENLRKKWLDSSHEFATEGVKDLMKGVDFPKLSAFLKGMGQNMVDGIKLNIAKDENEVEKNIRANRDKVLKVLLDERPIAKVAETFTKDLASLGVLWSQMDEAVLRTEGETQAMMIEKMSFLMDEAKKGYSLTAEQLIEDAQKNGSPFIQAWLGGLTPDALAALVLKTQGFYDEYEDAVRKMVKRMEKRIEFERNQVGADGLSQNQRWEESKSRISRRQQVQGVDESWGMAGNDLAGVESSERTRVDLLQKELEIKREMYEEDKKRYAMELEAIEKRIYAEGDPKERAALIQEAEAIKTASLLAEQEAWNGIQDAQRQASEAQFELMSKSVEQIKPYYDNLNSFAESFGENIFGSKDDREQAGRELLSNVIKTTGRMLTQWLVYVSTKQMFDKMEILNEEVKQKQLLAIKLQAQAAELSALGQTAQAEEAVKAAQNATDAASAQAKEAAKAGWVGWAIGAGLSLLMTMIFSALSAKTKSAIAAATGVSGSAGKLATGMLTYAKGRYPVYAEGYADDGNGRVQGQMVSVRGDDGRDYRAMYKPQLRTGVVNGPHLGIVGEKGAELIVDHGTYEGLKRYDPETLRRIYAMKMYGQRSVDFGRAARTGNEVLLNRSGVRRYADGNVEDALARDGVGDGAAEGIMAGMQETLAELTAVLAAVKAEGIQAKMEYLGSSGAKSTMDKGDRFLRRVGKG